MPSWDDRCKADQEYIDMLHAKARDLRESGHWFRAFIARMEAERAIEEFEMRNRYHDGLTTPEDVEHR